MLKNNDVVLISSCNYTLHTKNVLNAQIITDELANSGVKVLFVESLGLKTVPTIGKTDVYKVFKRLFDFILLFFRGISQPRENVYVLSLVRLPFENIRLIKKLNENIITFFVKKYSNKYLKPKPILWIFLPTGQFLIDKVNHSASIYHCVDDYSEVPNVDKEYVLGQQNIILQKANLVITVSPVMRDEFAKVVDSGKVHYLNNVAKFSFFNSALKDNLEAPEDFKPVLEKGLPVVGFMGNLASYKENLELLAEVAKENSDISFVFIGPIGSGEVGTDVSKLKALDNVYLLGPRDYDLLPAYFKYWDVAVIARRRNKANEGGFPLKYFEYLSSGLPVVVTGIKSLAEFSSNPALGSVADTPVEFTNALKYWINMKRSDSVMWNELLSKRLKIASENSWEKRILDFDRIVSKYL